MEGCSPGSSQEAIESQRVDIGGILVSQTPQVTHAFSVKNLGSRDINVLSISKVCSCTDAILGDTHLVPGESTTLTLKVNLAAIKKDWDIACRLNLDSPLQKEAEFRLTFRTYPALQFREPTINLGQLDRRIRTDKDAPLLFGKTEVELYRGATHSATDEDAVLNSESDLFTLAKHPPQVESLENGSIKQIRFPIDIFLVNAAANSAFSVSGTCTSLVTAEDRQLHRAAVSLMWETPSSVEITPPSLSFGVVSHQNTEVIRTVEMRSADGTPLKIQEAKLPSCLKLVENLQLSNTECRLRFRLDPSELKSRFSSGFVTLALASRESPSVDLRWTAILARQKEPNSASTSRE